MTLDAHDAIFGSRSAVVTLAAGPSKRPEWAIPPELTEGPETEIVEVGSTAAFTCKAQGSPQPEIIWTKNGEVIEEFKGKEVSEVT